MIELEFYNSTGEKIDTESGAVLNMQDDQVKEQFLNGLRLSIDPTDRRVKLYFRAKKTAHDRSEQFMADYLNTNTERPLIELHNGVHQHISQWGFEHAPDTNEKSLLELMKNPTQHDYPPELIPESELATRVDTNLQVHIGVPSYEEAIGVLAARGGVDSVVVASKTDAGDFYHDIVVSVSEDEYNVPQILDK